MGSGESMTPSQAGTNLNYVNHNKLDWSQYCAAVPGPAASPDRNSVFFTHISQIFPA